MKKLLAIVLLLAMVLPMAACGKKEEPEGSMEFDVTPVPVEELVTPDPEESPGSTIGEVEEVTPDPNATPTPAPTPEANIDPDATEAPTKEKAPKNIDAALKINSDVFGWIKVPNTNIDYPILYDKNFYYNTHDIYKDKNNSGSVYSYYKQLTRNNIITAHNMRKAGTMFHGLHELQNKKENLKEKKNRTFTVDWFGLSKWEVFALYETTDAEPKSTLLENTHHLSDKTPAEITAWIEKQKSRSEIDLGVSVSPEDFLMTLVTCGDNYDYSEAQSRLYVFLKCTDAPKS